jgi:hypothetical protein
MGLPTSREQTYLTGVTKVPAVDMNAIQDAIIEVNRQIVRDHFTGSALAAGTWSTSGSPTVTGDSAGGSFGALLLDGVESVFTTDGLLATGNWRLRASARSTGVSATTDYRFGIATPGSGVLEFMIDGASSTTNWRVNINNVSTAANGTAAPISSTLKEFEIRRVGTTITFLVNNVVMHTVSSYSSSMTLAALIFTLNVTGGSTQLTDWVTFGPIP